MRSFGITGMRPWNPWLIPSALPPELRRMEVHLEATHVALSLGFPAVLASNCYTGFFL